MGACQSKKGVQGAVVVNAEVVVCTDPVQEALARHRTFAVPQANFSVPVRTAVKFGWKKDLPDFRDRFVDFRKHSKVAGKALPAKVDLRPQEAFPVYDQGHLGSCTANALAAAFHFEQVKQGIKDFCPSRLLIYYNERAMEDSIADDSGAMIRDGIIALNKLGVCDEALWPYDVDKFTTRPSEEAYTAAAKNTAKEYARVEQTLDDLRGCIAAGYPFVFGFAVYSDIYSPEVQTKGKMKFPPVGQVLGGHAVQACGYDDSLQCFVVRNSWGKDWGDQGHFYMPYQYITHPQLCGDFWAINFVGCAEFPTRKHSMDIAPPLKYFSVPERAFCIKVRSVKRMGWKPDLPSIHDRFLHVCKHSKISGRALPTAVDLRPTEKFPVYNQGELGSCTANAIGAAFEFEQLRQGLKPFTPSRLFIYYNERAMEDTIAQDSGAMISDGIASLHKLGVCSEDMWPYDVAKFTVQPTAECYTAALKNTAKDYARVEQTLDDLRGCLAAGFPFVFGFAVYSDFMFLDKVMNYPPHGEMLGGHAVQACGYDDSKRQFIVRNSWGSEWGDAGYFYMPYEYMTDPNLASDFWAIQFVEGEFPTKARA